MKLLYPLIFAILLIFTACQSQEKTQFSDAALAQTIYNLQGEQTTVKAVIEQHKGKTIMIDIWASWCPDCIKSLLKLSAVQVENPEVVYVFLSVDDKESAWKNGISKYMNKYDIKGNHYFFNTGWNDDTQNAFLEDIDLDWIPRYMVINKQGKISKFYSKSIEDKSLIRALKE